MFGALTFASSNNIKPLSYIEKIEVKISDKIHRTIYCLSIFWDNIFKSRVPVVFYDNLETKEGNHLYLGVYRI